MSDKKFRATPAARRYAKEHGIDLSQVKGTGAKGRVHLDDITEFKLHGRIKISPLALKIAEVEGLNVQVIQGTGPKGKIMKEDVLALLHGEDNKEEKAVAAKSEAKPVEKEENPDYEVVKISPVKKVVGKRMRESVDISPTYMVSVSVDMTNLLAFRKQTVDMVVDRVGQKPSVTDYISLATVKTLQKHPYVNSSVSEDGQNILLHKHVSLAIAVGTDEGLYVPVVKNADEMSFTELVVESKRVIKATLDKKLKPVEMQGSTFTISNLGMYGVDNFTSIINQPNTAILSVSATIQKPVVVNGEIVVRPMMNVSLNADHRVIDGLEGAKFMQTLKNNLENPVGLLI
ncbi:dihydrolipoamide acetyltransferase [Helcococcus ovis]|uniref:dihydrolipoamide acetyltransferase n=1 Tax=Helcococcus ovis TaxID=72026 RepID=UPI0038BC6FB9